jgi:nitrogen-specific signal transduction histidine kinase/CheY-like chemotaxis protein
LTQAREARLNLERARDLLFQSQKMEAIGQLTGGVAHDFNNLLTVILGGLEILQRRLPEDPNITPLLENAIQAAKRGSLLTQRMLAFARRQDLKPEAVDLSALVHGMTDLLQRSLGPSIMIETQFPRFLDPVRVDPNQLELAILNLAMNGRDAMPDGGSIIIAARPENSISDRNGEPSFDRYICLTVADRGEGMDDATLSRAMEPFFTTKEVGKGTGLGLSMVHGLAEQSGGHFTLKSRKGYGTVAELLLPIAGDCIRVVRPGATGQASFLPNGKSGPVAVLAVDDDRLVLMNTTAMLNEMGHRTFAATSGDQALDIIHREKAIDLVIIDHAMPGMSGAELAEAIKCEWPSMPIIFATPLAEESLQTVAKPLRQEDLVRAIARIQLSQKEKIPM